MIENHTVIPALSAEVSLMNNEDSWYLYHRTENKFVLLENMVAIRIVEDCNGENTVEAIVDNMHGLYNKVERKRIQKDIIKMISFLKNEGFIIFRP